MQEEDRLARVGNWKAARSDSVDSLPRNNIKIHLIFITLKTICFRWGGRGRARKQKQELLSCGWNSTGSEKWLSRVRSLNRIKQWKCFSPPFRKYDIFFFYFHFWVWCCCRLHIVVIAKGIIWCTHWKGKLFRFQTRTRLWAVKNIRINQHQRKLRWKTSAVSVKSSMLMLATLCWWLREIFPMT